MTASGQESAESAEGAGVGCADAGRARRGADAGRLGWAEAGVWTERMVSALVNGVKGGRWFSLIDKVYAPATLALAWQKVRSNGGAAGVDGVSVDRFAARADEYLAELSRELRTGSYRPQAVRRVEIPKGDGRTRPLGIPAVKDRIAQAAVKLVIEPIFEVAFLEGSYGFRPGRGCHDALREVDRALKEGLTHVVDADLASYFDSIPHARLKARVEERVSDGPVLALLDGWMAAQVMAGLERWTPTSGTPQGAVISPLLANIYLHPLDALMAAHGYRMVRYADDFVVLCASREAAEAALALVSTWVAENGLHLHPDKTRLADFEQPGQGFDFLGYRFENKRRHVRKKSLASLRDRIREKTGRTRGKGLERTIADLNRTLRGWYGYFKYACPSTFVPIDQFVRRRLRAMLRYQEKRKGHGRCWNDHVKWPNAFFARAGLFALHTACLNARPSR